MSPLQRNTLQTLGIVCIVVAFECVMGWLYGRHNTPPTPALPEHVRGRVLAPYVEDGMCMEER